MSKNHNLSITTAIILLFGAIFLSSCNNKIDPHQVEYEPVEVAITMGRETISSLQSQGEGELPEAGGIIAIQIYQREPASSGDYKPFCYGLWDEPSELKMTLNKGCYYRFELTYLPQAKGIVAFDDKNLVYRQPFSLLGTGADGQIRNQFIYHSSHRFSGLSKGQTAVNEGKSYRLYTRPLAMRYYANREEVLIESSTTVTLRACLVVFALKYEIVGLKEGTLLISMSNSPEIELTSMNHNTREDFITLQGNPSDPDDWTMDNYSERIECKVTWIKSNGDRMEIDNRDFNVIRKKHYTLKVDLTQSESTGGIGISMEDSEFGDGGYI